MRSIIIYSCRLCVAGAMRVCMRVRVSSRVRFLSNVLVMFICVACLFEYRLSTTVRVKCVYVCVCMFVAAGIQVYRSQSCPTTHVFHVKGAYFSIHPPVGIILLIPSTLTLVCRWFARKHPLMFV